MSARNLVLLVAVCALLTGCGSPHLRGSAPVLLDGIWEYYSGNSSGSAAS